LLTDNRLILLLKISIGIGLSLLLIGIYMHMYSDYIASLGVSGIIISALFIALGLVFSLPTKMYLTFVLMKIEAERTIEKNKQKQD